MITAALSGQKGRDVSATLLLVDDEEGILNSLSRLFHPLGYKLLLAKGGEDGLKLLERESVDLILSDMRMPMMDGVTFLTEAAKRWPDTMRILLTGYADIKSTIDAINKGNIYKYVAKPWDNDDLKITVHHALEARFLEQDHRRLLELTSKQNDELKDLNANLEQKVRERTQELSKTMEMLEAAHDSLKKSYTSSIKVFSSLIELREGSAAGYSRRVAEQARSLALGLGMSAEDAQHVMFAGLLHDIGKMVLPDRLLHKALNTLGPDDRIKIDKHPVIGQGILMALVPLQEAARLIRSHRERYDGHGHPDGLRGDKIPLGARILAVVSDFEALQQGRLSPQKLSPVEATDFLAKNRGKLYDPGVVDAFLQHRDTSSVQEKEQEGTLTKVADLQSDMLLARDLVTSDGVLLLSKGYKLDDNLINKIRNFESSVGKTLDVYVANRSK